MRFKFWLVSVALAVSLIFGFASAPLILNTQTSSLPVDETIAYAPKVQEVLNGHLFLSDTFIWEYKDFPSPLRGEIIPAVVMAGLAKLGGKVDKAFILADFIFPAISFLLLTAFFNLLTHKKYFSIVSALIIMFFYNYFKLFPYLPSAVKQFIESWNVGYPSPFLRAFHPQISFPFLILGLIFLLKKHWWFLGIILGLLFYTDFFYWTFFLVLVTLNRQWKSLSLGLILGLPYLYNVFAFNRLDLSQSFITNLTFKPVGEIEPMLLMLALALVARVKFWRRFFLSVVLIFFGSKLTGLALDDPIGHWKIRIIYPFVFAWLLTLITPRLKFKKTIWIGFTLLLLLYQARVHRQWFSRQTQSFAIEPERIEVFNWINQNTPKDSVILTTGLKDNLYLVIFTHANVFIPRSQHSLAPDDEALNRFLILSKAAGISENRIKMMFTLTDENKILKAQGRFNFDDCGGHYLYFRRFVGNDYYNCSVSPEHLSKILSDYVMIDGDLNRWKKKYRMDYWLTTESIDFGHLVWENKTYKIYALD